MYTQELIDYLVSLGFNVYPDPNHMPDVDEDLLPAMFVFSTGGSGPDHDLPIKFPSYQIIVKGKSIRESNDELSLTEILANNLIKALDKKHNYVIGGNTIYYSRATQSSPIPIGLDVHDRPVYSTNFTFKLQPALKGAN